MAMLNPNEPLNNFGKKIDNANLAILQSLLSSTCNALTMNEN